MSKRYVCKLKIEINFIEWLTEIYVWYKVIKEVFYG